MDCLTTGPVFTWETHGIQTAAGAHRSRTMDQTAVESGNYDVVIPDEVTW